MCVTCHFSLENRFSHRPSCEGLFSFREYPRRSFRQTHSPCQHQDACVPGTSAAPSPALPPRAGLFARPLLVRTSFLCWLGMLHDRQSCLCTNSAFKKRVERLDLSPSGSHSLLHPCWLTSASTQSRGRFPSSLLAILLCSRQRCLAFSSFFARLSLCQTPRHRARRKDSSALVADTLPRTSRCPTVISSTVISLTLLTRRPRFKLGFSSRVPQGSDSCSCGRISCSW